MAALTDIVPVGQQVQVAGTTVEVFGLTGRAISLLLGRFPDVRKVLTGQGADLDALIAMGPECVAAVGACGMRKPGDKAVEDWLLDNLMVGEWPDLLGPILKQTMPKGVAPFVQMLADMGLKASNVDAAPGTEPATKSPKR